MVRASEHIPFPRQIAWTVAYFQSKHIWLQLNRLHDNISDKIDKISQLKVFRRDLSVKQETGIAIYLADWLNGYHRQELETSDMYCIWLQIKLKNQSPIVGYLYWNPSAASIWYDKFTTMMDTVLTEMKDIILLVDFNGIPTNRTQHWKT